MDMNNAFPSKYLGAADFANGPSQLQIAGVRMEDVSKDSEPMDNKPILYFTGVERGIVLNVTNNKMLCTIFGGESDHWVNQVVEIYVIDTEYQGQPKKGLRIRGIQQQVQQPMPQPMGGPNAAPGQVSQAVNQPYGAPPNYVPNGGYQPGPAPAPTGPTQPAGPEHLDDGLPELA